MSRHGNQARKGSLLRESNAWRQWLGWSVSVEGYALSGRPDITGPRKGNRGCLGLRVGPGDWIGTYVVLGKSWAEIDLDQTFSVRCTVSKSSRS